MLTNVLLALVLSAAIALATGPKLIEWLRGHQMKTSENELGPKEHLKKRGTPIMGGLMIALGCIVSFVLCAAYTGAWVTTILPLLLVSPKPIPVCPTSPGILSLPRFETPAYSVPALPAAAPLPPAVPPILPAS